MLSEISELVLQYLGIDTTKNAKNTLNIIEHYKTFRRLEVLDLPRLCNSTSSRDSTFAFMEEGSHVHMSLDGLKMWWTDVNGQRCVHMWPSDQVKLAAGWRLQISGQGHVEMWIIWNSFESPTCIETALVARFLVTRSGGPTKNLVSCARHAVQKLAAISLVEFAMRGHFFFKHVDFRTLELVCERLAWSPFPKLRCWWTEDVRRYNAGLFCILEFNFVWFSGNLRLSRILDDSSKRLC